MAIKEKRKGGRVYLEEYESVRVGDKIESRFVRYLGPKDPSSKRAGSRGSTLERLQMSTSTRAGSVGVLHRLAEDLQFRAQIDTICGVPSTPGEPSPGQLLTAWAINRVLDTKSATQLEHWVPSTDLPRLLALPPEAFTKDNFLRALDAVVRRDPASGSLIDHTVELDRALTKAWREAHPLPKNQRRIVAYDLTDVLFFGVTCPLAELGYNAKAEARLEVQVGVALERYDRMPDWHGVFPGSRHDSTTVRNLLAGLAQAGLPPGHLVWDRALTSRDHVRLVRDAGWHLIAGLSRSLTTVKDLLDDVQVPTTHHTYAKRTRSGGAAYALATTAKLWSKQEAVPVVVYVNNDKAARDLNDRQEGLAEAVQALEALNQEEATRSMREGELRKRVKAITGPWGRFLRVRIRRGGKGPRLVVEYRERELAAEARRDGKGVILNTDSKVSAQEAVREYFAKDDVEKVFRSLKSDVEVEPVRHRLEWRVRAYVFVNLLAYRLEAALRFSLAQAGVQDAHHEVEALLRDLERVERVPVRFGAQERVWFLNVNDRIRKNLKRLGYAEMFAERSKVRP